MTSQQLLSTLQAAAGLSSTTETGADSLIGFFQAFRPDGEGLEHFFENFQGEAEFQINQTVGNALDARISELFAAAGKSRRPQGGHDAYFVVRDPPVIEPEHAEHYAVQWLARLREFAAFVGQGETERLLHENIHVRVLEGHPPKPPKDESDKTAFFGVMQSSVPRLVDRLDAGPIPELLSKAYYFTACDPMLRDYLMWPLFESACEVPDPYASYFHLWRHGIKYRIFQPDQIDVYLPRRSS